jgi:hypothetical protein
MIRTISVGPVPIFFTNVNKAMGLPGHSHHAELLVVYGYEEGHHGYPSFETTNDELERHVLELTSKVFRDATNEVVVERIWNHLVEYVGSSWEGWGGEYWLHAIHLDVVGVHDAIGHDDSTTRYSVALDADDLRVLLPERVPVQGRTRAPAAV